jgi:hypothetical protein
MPGLADDTYTVSETVAPAGFAPAAPQIADFTTLGPPPQTITLAFNDPPQQTGPTDTLIIKKVGVTATGKSTPLGGATFVTSPGGATCTTSSTGTCTITGLPIGTYTVAEASAPSGFALAAPQVVTFISAPQTQTLGFTDTPAVGTP